LLFDGECNLCSGAVAFVLRRDRSGAFRFASLQSPAGRALLRRHGRSTSSLSTVVLIDGDRVLLRSDAVLEVARRLGGAWPLLYGLLLVPRALRDRLYDVIARRRRRWFGRRETCLLPTPEVADRFIDRAPSSAPGRRRPHRSAAARGPLE
jgi:predicted DCC family thiol-disulfide oxidoreductase YuxK